MISKHPVCPDRVRRVPGQFSWVDHRLVRDGHIERCSHASAALYLFLVTVSDARGLSYYSDASLMKRLGMDAATLEQSRSRLIRLSLVAYKKPIYQVLPLSEPVVEKTPARKSGTPRALGEILRQIAGEGK